MAYTTSTQPLLGEISRSAAFFDGLRVKLRQRRLYKETFNSLNNLTDRELEDLGVYRGDIRRIAIDSAKGVRG